MNQKGTTIVILVPLACICMAFSETVLPLSYPIKILIRILLFSGSVLFYFLTFRDHKWKDLFSVVSIKLSLLLSAGAFAVILGGFYLLQNWIDLDSIAAKLTSGQQIHRDNFLLVALYICLFNSFLEELFFRGFAWLTLRRHWQDSHASVFSAAAFALYHVSILSGWFPLWLFLLMLAGLFVCGLLFNDLDRKGSIFPSWLLHAAANTAINLIGFSMFGLL